jgi:hypothetical protein
MRRKSCLISQRNQTEINPFSTSAGDASGSGFRSIESRRHPGAQVQEQSGMCALGSEPGSAGGLVVDTDDLRKRIRGLLHRKCKTFLSLGRDNPLRFQMAITYLERKGSPLSGPDNKGIVSPSLRQIAPFQNPPESKDGN